MNVNLSLIILVFLLAGIFILWLLVRNGVLSLRVQSGAVVAQVLGVIGVGVSLLTLAGNGSQIVMVGVMVSGSILFGCGTIAAAIQRKD
jgi:hypothetical protein